MRRIPLATVPFALVLPLAVGCGSKLARPEVEMPAFLDLAEISPLAEAHPNDARPQGVAPHAASPEAEKVATALEPRRRDVTEAEIARALADSRAGAAPTFPVRVLVVEVVSSGPSGVEARPVGAHELGQFRAALEESRGVVASVDTIPAPFLPVAVDLPSLRYQAARFGAQALLVLARGASDYEFANGWAFLYPTVVGLVLAPGRSQEVWIVAEGVLVDVATGRPLGVVEAESRLDRASLLFADSDRGQRELEREAQGALFRSLAGRAVSALEEAVARGRG